MCAQLFGDGPIDRLHQGLTFFQNFSTVQAHHLQTQREQGPITTSVFQGVIASQVLCAIHCHDQLCPWREDIRTVLTDGLLSIALDAKKLCIPQA